jgi:hypothetical protein
MFPKRAKIKPAEQARQLELELREAAKLAPAEREAKLRELDERTQLLIDSVEDGCGLRLDGTLTHPPSGQQIWYDTTTVHTTCRSKIKKELALTRIRRAAGKEGTVQFFFFGPVQFFAPLDIKKLDRLGVSERGVTLKKKVATFQFFTPDH